MARKVTPADLQALRHAADALAGDAHAAPTRDDLARASRTVCALLAARYPGRVVELRVPPFAAVQLGFGDRGAHTRGTPPNVVQTDPATLLALAAGRLGWDEAVGSHRVSASGPRSDLGAAFPLPELG